VIDNDTDIYCSWVSTGWQRYSTKGENTQSNTKNTETQTAQYRQQKYKTKANIKNIRKHKSINYKITKRSTNNQTITAQNLYTAT
jgi:hypothetical protein